MNIKGIFLLLFTTIYLLFTGCGYKPASYYAKDEIKGKIYIDYKVNINDIKNAILVKDSVIELFLREFNVKIVSNKNEANEIVYLKLDSVKHQSMTTSSLDGFTSMYRTTVKISMKYGGKYISLQDYYDYNIDTSATLTEQKKDEAVRIATQNALKKIFSKIAINSFKKSKDEAK